MNKVRIVSVTECKGCPFHTFDGDDPHKWGKMWCDKLDREIIGDIPEDCPLPMVESSSVL